MRRVLLSGLVKRMMLIKHSVLRRQGVGQDEVACVAYLEDVGCLQIRKSTVSMKPLLMFTLPGDSLNMGISKIRSYY